MPDCLFCKIAAKEIPAEVIYEDNDTMAFLDVHPRTPAHALVIPKKHAENLSSLDDSQIKPLFSTVQKIAKLLKGVLKADGLTIGINEGRASGQEVDHLHIHIMPRYTNDNGGSIQSVVNNHPSETIKQIKEKILNSQN
ncbi:HIT family protein [Patescibacteria group bacterium]|nr:HIT family protein [Patescibacteria group bacterium]MCL5733333.1 HIT family protein [Patescibacteria group bacterium]